MSDVAEEGDEADGEDEADDEDVAGKVDEAGVVGVADIAEKVDVAGVEDEAEEAEERDEGAEVEKDDLHLHLHLLPNLPPLELQTLQVELDHPSQEEQNQLQEGDKCRLLNSN